MDYKEAIEKHTNECRHRIDVIRNHMNTNGDYDKDVCNKNIDVPKIAISALNEIQAMHNNGIKRLMDELVEYKQLGTLEEVLDAVEKQKRKKPKNVNTEGYRYTDTYRCPTCGGNFSGTGIADYCYHRGQAIDWSEDE